jgi:hypothetical protein
MARSNSAKAPTAYIIMRPAGVVVSIFSVIEPAAARRTCRGWGMQPGSPEYIHCRTVLVQQEHCKLPDRCREPSSRGRHDCGFGAFARPAPVLACGARARERRKGWRDRNPSLAQVGR